MNLMRQMRITMDADAIAKGVLAMMRERHLASQDAEDDETIIRFGMLPARWMNMLESQMDAVIRERFDLLPKRSSDRDEYTTIIKDPNAEDGHRMVTFKMRDLVNEMVHEVSLAMYSNVDMVV